MNILEAMKALLDYKSVKLNDKEGFVHLDDDGFLVDEAGRKSAFYFHGSNHLSKPDFERILNDVSDDGYEVKDDPLNFMEKEYIGNLIKPFHDKVINIYKSQELTHGYEGINIRMKSPDTDILLPYFKAGTMYKGMKLGKGYSLEDLGL